MSFVTYEAVELANGHYGVQVVGADAPYDAAGEFDTMTEAEEWIFNESERQQAHGDDDILLPGTGQGLR